jgi:CRISPR/Cas system-associated endonuclease Cas3-HD
MGSLDKKEVGKAFKAYQRGARYKIDNTFIKEELTNA